MHTHTRAHLEQVHDRTIYSIAGASEACGGLIATAGADDTLCLLRADM